MGNWKAVLSASVAGFLLCSTLPAYAKTANNRDLDFDIHAKTTSPIPKKEIGAKIFRNVHDSSNLYIIQFDGPIQEEWKEEVEDLDISLGWYLPDYAYIAKLPDRKETVDKLEELSFIKKVAEYKPTYKVHPDLIEEVEEKDKVQVYVESFDPTTEVDRVIKKAGGTIQSQSRNQANVEIDSDKIGELLESDEVIYVAPVAKKHLRNDIASQIIGSNKLQKTKYDGKKQVVSVADTGLDTGDLKTMHPDLRGQVSKLIRVGPDSRDYSGHGTHVLGSIVGKGVMSDGQVKGMAPGAKAIVYTVDDGFGGIVNFDINKLWTDAYKKGARINSLSLGTNEYGEYGYDSQSTDIFLWEHPEAISLVAAGNSGDEFEDEYYTVTPPATSKNAIAVGASESYRPEYGQDSDDVDQVAEFSSRGPTNDGRIKPDVVAPGTSIFSTRSLYGDEYDDIVDAYGMMSGTSMATPIAAGGVAQIRQYLQEKGTDNPSGALLKGMLISGADDLGDNLARMGFGRINLPNSIDTSFVDQKAGVKTGQSLTYEVEVKNTNDPFNVTLVWTDYPASLFASRALVNDLDLVVTTPSGEQFNGNDFDDEPDNERDNLNNVEQVYITDPEKGTYTVTVTGANIPKGPQPFALVSNGEITPKLIDETGLKASATLSKDTIKLTLKGSVDASVSSVKVNAPGIKNASAKVSKSAFSFSKSVKAGSYPIEEIEITAANKQGDKETIQVQVEADLIEEDNISFEEVEAEGSFSYTLSGEVDTDVKALSYISNKKLIPIEIEDGAFEATIESKNELVKLVLVIVDKKGNYEIVEKQLND